MSVESTILHGITPEQLFDKLNELSELVQNQESTKLEKQPPDELMTPNEVASYFKKHKDTIENWTRNGFLIKYGIGRAVFYKRLEIEAALIPLK